MPTQQDRFLSFQVKICQEVAFQLQRDKKIDPSVPLETERSI